MDTYCMDTSSLIEMKNRYPRDVFPNVWEKIEELCRKGRLIAPTEVREEIKQGDDELKKWATGKKKVFIRPNKKQIEVLKEILKKYPSLAKPEKPGPNADPWLIALAVERNRGEKEKLFYDKKYIVVTEESKTKQDRIPAVCQDYNIEYVNLIELFKKEGWKF